jgi:hypothetical protein
MKASIASVVVTGLLAPVALADNFIASCVANSVQASGNVLTAQCYDISRNLRCTRLDLSRCLKNVYGSIQADPNADGYVYYMS